MFFQSIYQTITEGTDMNINIRKVGNSLSVAVMPRRNGMKGEMQQNMVPLIVSGTPAELDAGFLQTIAQPLQKVQGLLINAENFEKQAETAAAQAKSSKTPATTGESKEAREKREKMEKLLKKADEASTAQRFSEAQTWLKQARLLAPAERHKEIDSKIQEVQKQADAGSLFGMAEEPVQAMPQPQGCMTGQQPGMFPGQPAETAIPPKQVMQTVQQQIPQPVPQQTYSAMPQPAYTPNGGQMQPPQSQPVQGGFIPQNGTIPIYPHQQGTTHYPPQPTASNMQTNGNGREYQAAPAGNETFCFDPEDENDRELLKEDPYAEYPDFPAEYRMRDEAQVEMVYC